MRIAILSVHTCPLITPGSRREAGGMNVYLNMLTHQLASRGIAVDVFTRWHDPAEPEVMEAAPGLRVIHVEAGGRGPQPDRPLPPLTGSVTEQILAFQQREGLVYDLVHAHYWLSGLVGLELKQRWGVPLIAMFHTLGAVKNQARAGEHEPLGRIAAEHEVIAGADALVAATEDERDLMARLYDADVSHVQVIPLGVDTSTFHPLEKQLARKALGLNGERLLLFVGRPDPLKGLEVLISAASQLDDPDGVRVIVVGGDGGSEEGFQRAHDLAAQIDMTSRVDYHGSVAHDRLPYYYSAADVCVIPSYYESFGLVALESMACGTPVVAARVGGLRSTVQDGETGYLIPWHCPEPYAERLELLLDNEMLRRALGTQAQAAAQSYSWSAVTDQIEALYERVLHTNPIGS
ncbi:MAG: glycosyltransferase family 1 protein [Dehalococcoidia bacterium]|nr:glycosyltransferase family 1 protein [Dehalococcoidia bacterium]